MTVKKQPIPFGKYYLLDRINIGGMAEVWRAKTFGEHGFEKLVAIKRILPNIAEDDEFISMFIDEAKITVQLTHANVAQVFDLGRIGDSYFIAMEYVAGRDFRAIFDRSRKKGEPAPIPMVCYMVSKMCEGLDYAHRKKDSAGRDLNIVHRDVSPQNCLVSFEGEVKVIDFGIAKAANKATKTQAGILKGKFGYMSPEQVRGLPLDQRSDVFACGVVLYELLTGERLFVGDSDFSVLEKVRQVDILPPTKYNRRIPEGLEKIVLKALARDPEDRFQYASDLSDALQRFLITSDSVFSRKDLMQYMKSTFAEDVEREKLRQAEYAEIKLPQGGMPAGQLPPLASHPVPVLGPTAATIVGSPPMAEDDPDGRTILASEPVGEATILGVPSMFAEQTPDEEGTIPGALPPSIGGDALRPPLAVGAGGIDASLDATLPASGGGLRVAPPTLAPTPPTVAPGQRPQALPVGRRPTTATPAVRAPTSQRIPIGPPAVEVVRPAARPLQPVEPPAETVANPNRKRLLLFGGIGLGLVLVVGLGAMAFAGGTGTLFVAYQPKDAIVAIDGVERCNTSPCFDSSLTAGPHEIEIYKEGYEPYRKAIEIPRGDIFRMPEISLRQIEKPISTIIGTAPAEAQVSIDGKVVKEQGRPDLYTTELIAGRTYEIEVSLPGYATWTKKVTVDANAKLHKEFAQLTREAFEVTFTSTPEGATVLIDDKVAGVTPFTTSDLDPAKTHSVIFRMRCYEDAPATVLAGSGSQELRKDLVRKPRCP